MIGKLFGAVARAATRKLTDAVVDKMMKPHNDSYPDEIVCKFQKFMRRRIYGYLLNEVNREYLGGKGKMTPAKMKKIEKILHENFKEICDAHIERKKELKALVLEEEKEQMGNLHPDYDRHDKLLNAAHYEAFIIVVMHEWGERGDIYLDADDDTETESFQVWNNSIDDAIRHGIVTMDEIESQEL